MKTNKSKHKTIETLSAYLDGQLSEQEAQIFRQRLEEDASLRNQLENLRQTRYVLKQTPKLKRQRSFVLSPEMVRQQRTVFRVMNISRAISAVASVLLVVFLGTQYLFSGGMGVASAPMADTANYEMAEDSAAAEPMMAMEAPEEEPAFEPAEEPAEEMRSGIADSTEEAATAGEAEAEEPAPPAAMDSVAEPDEIQGTQMPKGGGGESPPDNGEADQPQETPSPTVALEGAMRSQDMEDVDSPLEEDQDSSIPPEFPELQMDESADEMAVGELQPARSKISPFRVVQGILLLLAVAGGLSAAYFRKKVR